MNDPQPVLPDPPPTPEQTPDAPVTEPNPVEPVEFG
jgi:hypothetical protein